MTAVAALNWYQNELLWLLAVVIAVITGSRWFPQSLSRPIPRRSSVVYTRDRSQEEKEKAEKRKREREEEWSKPHQIAADKYLVPIVAGVLIGVTLVGGLIFPVWVGVPWGMVAAVAWRLVLRRLEKRLADKP